MKTILRNLLVVLIFTGTVSAQKRGAIPLDNIGDIIQPKPFNALVVGISKYNSSSLNLKYARKDAEMFAGFLNASTWSDSVSVLVDSQATASAIYRSIGDLIRYAKSGEDIYIYFAGHGDKVGDDILSQAYLLAHDASETRNYEGNGGVIDLTKLELYISKLIKAKKSKVYLILDACHSGFDPFEKGSLLAMDDLSSGFENANKLLSCGPEEYSYEIDGMEQGVFTYHLIRGMSGLADNPSNGVVSFYELKQYLKKQVPRSAPGPQNPVILGSDTLAEMGTVSRELLAQIQSQELLALGGGNRSLKGDPNKSALDPAIKNLVADFNEAMQMAAYYGAEHTALAAIQKSDEINGFPVLLRERMKDLLVEKLNLNAQLAINQVLTGRTKLPSASYFEQQAEHLKTCLTLIDEDNPQFESIRVNYLFLQAFSHYRATRFEKYDEAMALLDSAISLEKRAAYLYHTKGLIHDYRDEYDSAIHYYDKALALIPNWKYPMNAKGNSLKSSGRYAAAIKQFEKVIQLDSTFYWSYNNLGNVYLDMGIYRLAESYYYKRLEMSPEEPSIVYNNLGVVAKNRGNLKAAEAYYKKAIAEDSLYYTTMDNLGDFYADEVKKPDKAVHYYNEAIRVQPFHGSAYTGLADFYRRRSAMRSDYIVADSLYRVSISLNPYNTWSWFGYAYLKKEKYKDLNGADSLLREARKWNGHKASFWNDMGRFYRNTNRKDSSVILFNKAIALDSFYQYAYTNLSSFYEGQEDYKQAEELLIRYSKLNPQNPEGWMKLGNYYYSRLNMAKSREAYEEALKYDPEYSSAKLSLSVLYLDEGNVEPSVRLYQEAYEENPTGLGKGVYLTYALRKIGSTVEKGKRFHATRLLLPINPYSISILNNAVRYAYEEDVKDLNIPQIDSLLDLDETIPSVKSKLAFYQALINIDQNNGDAALRYYDIYRANTPNPDQRIMVVIYQIKGETELAKRLLMTLEAEVPGSPYSENFINKYKEVQP